MNKKELLDLESCFIAAISILLSESDRNQLDFSLDDWMSQNRKKISIEVKRLMTRHIVDITNDKNWHNLIASSTNSNEISKDSVESWKKYLK